MIPRTLQIKNFLSYGTECPLISFDDHALICLSGNNGHGKSALLDAMTWALWGSARKIQNSVRADQGLLRLGETNMLVIFDCMINNTVYRIKREFELVYGKPKITLDIGIIDHDGTIRPLTEKTIRDTQAKIDTIIGLDYETFINSSFLRQGNANEFSKRSPKERKEIIGTILGLGMYELLKKAALEKSKNATQEAIAFRTLMTHAASELDAITALLNHYPAFCTQLGQITEQLQQCARIMATLKTAITEQESKKQPLLASLQDYELKKTVYNQTVATLKKLVQLWRSTRARTIDLHAQTQAQGALRATEEQLLAAQTHYNEYRALHDQLQKLTLQKAQLTQTVESAIVRLKAEQNIVYERIGNTLKHLQEQQNAVTLHEKTIVHERTTVEQALAHETMLISQLSAHVAEIDTLQKRFDKRKETYHRWTTLGNVIREEHGTQLQRLQLAHDTTDPSCPLCEQSLSASRKRFLQTKIEGQIYGHAQRLSRFKRLLPRLKELLLADHEQLQQLALQKTELHTVQHAHAQKKQRIEQLKSELTTLVTKQTTLAQQHKDVTAQQYQLAAQLTTDPSTPEIENIKTELHKIAHAIMEQTACINALAYDPSQMLTLQKKVSALKSSIEQYEQHTHALLMQEERKQQIKKLCAQLKEGKQDTSARDMIYKELQQLTSAITQLHAKELQIQTQEKELRKTHEKLLVEQGTFNAAQTSHTTLTKKSAELEIQLKKSEAVAHDYQAIATAVGKDGIQALLIEEAIPEIEEYANQLLAKLTNNTAHIMIESLRDLKSGGTKETLDIKISDTQGVRPYEMFSGGEAFRIDISLRIAIAKLLAHRAGTALQTLIIDEGFGSQDEEGLGALIDVLHTLRDEFAKIIVVSHLPIMKDQFPVHFHVEKGTQGSIVRIIEQG